MLQPTYGYKTLFINLTSTTQSQKSYLPGKERYQKRVEIKQLDDVDEANQFNKLKAHVQMFSQWKLAKLKEVFKKEDTKIKTT